jgi:hypothetical protein
VIDDRAGNGVGLGQRGQRGLERRVHGVAQQNQGSGDLFDRRAQRVAQHQRGLEGAGLEQVGLLERLRSDVLGQGLGHAFQLRPELTVRAHGCTKDLGRRQRSDLRARGLVGECAVVGLDRLADMPPGGGLLEHLLARVLLEARAQRSRRTGSIARGELQL